MAALTAARKTPRRRMIHMAPLAGIAASTVFDGSLASFNAAGTGIAGMVTATGLAFPGRAHIPSGKHQALVNEKVEIYFDAFRWVNGESITIAALGDLAYAGDDQTVFTTATGRSVAGIIVDVDSLGVWVLSYPGMRLA